MLDQEIRDLAAEVIAVARAKGVRLTTAESCTGGLVAAALTGVAGSSAVFDRGFITYSNEAKSGMIGVSETVILDHGAVSAEVAGAMATGARAASGVELAVAVTGIAGPGGGSAKKPVGLVWFGIASDADTGTREMRFGDLGRDNVRREAVSVALRMLLERLTA